MTRRTALLIYLAVAVVLTAILLPATLLAVRLKPGDESDTQTQRPGPPEPPPQDHPLRQFLGRVRIEGPYSDRGLSVFVLSADRPETSVDYLTLDDGLASGQLVVQEAGEQGSVPTLQIMNRSDRQAFLMSGELVTGGKQNRTLRQDVLMPPRSSAWLNLPVWCVEQSRWQGGGKFGAGNAAAPNAIRSGLNQGMAQEGVWREVDRQQKAAGVQSGTNDVNALYDDAKRAKEIDACTKRLIGLIPRREYLGLVIARGGDIVSADLFANTPLYRRLYEKVLRSHVVEALGHEYSGRPSVGEVRGFLDRAMRAPVTSQDAPVGMGHLFTVGGNGIGGQGLETDGRVVHAALFPQMVMPMPIPRPPRPPRPPGPPVPMPYRENTPRGDD